MSRVITIRISGRGAGTDAPSADDLLDQVRDYLEILRGVEAAVAEDGQNAIDWRVVDAHKNSPLALQFAPFPRQYAVNIDHRVEIVARRTAEGLKALQERPERPPYFTDKVVARVERVCARVTNGLDLSEVSFGEGLPTAVVTAATARAAARNALLILKPTDRPYKEAGSVEGISQGVQKDGYGRHLLYIKSRVSGEEVKCILRGAAEQKVEERRIADILRGCRVLVSGTIEYRSLGSIFQVIATDVNFLRSHAELPGVDDILDETFTGGLRTEEYLERLRDGNLN
jgi:hypothetical protein